MGLLHKLKQNSISGKLFDIITDFFKLQKTKGCFKWEVFFMD